MEINGYKKTNLPIKLPILDLKPNNFIDIFHQFDLEVKDYQFNDFINEEEFQNENEFKSGEKINKEELKESENEYYQNIELYDNGSIEIKNDNNKFSNKKNNNIILSGFDEENENIEINNINNENIEINNDNENNYNINNINYIDDINNNDKDIEINLERNNYKQTDISKINQINDILKNDKFNRMIDYIDNNVNLNNNNINNSDSANVRLNLDSDNKNKIQQIFYTIPEEDNESYDSMSLHKSVRSGTKATPNYQENKKKSFNFIPELNINNNLFNTFSKDDKNSNNNNIMIEEINLRSEDKNNINNENKIKTIDLGFNSGDFNDINFTTPESKEKTMETIYKNNKNINEEKDNICELKEFSPLENEDLKFSDFNPILNENDIKEKEKMDNINNENVNIINENNLNLGQNGDIKINKVIKKNKFKNEYLTYYIIDKKNKKILFLGNKDNNKRFNISYFSYFRILQLCLKIKLTQNKIYENFMRRLMNRFQKDFKNIHQIDQNIEINKDLEVENNLNNLENKIKYLKECYLYLIVKKKKLKSKNEINKLITDLNIPKIKEDIENLLNNLLFYLKEKEKEKHFYYFYLMKTKKILNKYQIIHDYEINRANIKDEQKFLNPPKFEDIIFENRENNFKKRDKLYSAFSLLLPFLLIYIFFNLKSKSN